MRRQESERETGDGGEKKRSGRRQVEETGKQFSAHRTGRSDVPGSG